MDTWKRKAVLGDRVKGKMDREPLQVTNIREHPLPWLTSPNIVQGTDLPRTAIALCSQSSFCQDCSHVLSVPMQVLSPWELSNFSFSSKVYDLQGPLGGIPRDPGFKSDALMRWDLRDLRCKTG